ncbi:hypothetical protein ACRRTK_002605 [Alexandromys fortis]
MAATASPADKVGTRVPQVDTSRGRLRNQRSIPGAPPPSWSPARTLREGSRHLSDAVGGEGRGSGQVSPRAPQARHWWRQSPIAPRARCPPGALRRTVRSRGKAVAGRGEKGRSARRSLAFPPPDPSRLIPAAHPCRPIPATPSLPPHLCHPIPAAPSRPPHPGRPIPATPSLPPHPGRPIPATPSRPPHPGRPSSHYENCLS